MSIPQRSSRFIKCIRKLSFASIAISCIAGVSSAHAGEYCTQEKITQIITGSGMVFFTTDKSCPNWCQLPTAWSTDSINRSYSLMLSAFMSNRKVAFYWPTAATACQVVSVNSSPDNVIVQSE
jgi:hypothetical protein